MTPKQEEALRDYLQEAIVPLIEQVLVKKLGQAMTFAAQEVVSPKRTWVGLTDEEYSQLHDGLYQQGKSLGWAVDEIEAKLKEKNT